MSYDKIKEKNMGWYSNLSPDQKYVADQILKYHDYYKKQDEKYRRRVYALKVLVLALGLSSTIVLGLRTVINLETQVLVGLILSAVLSFVTALSSYFNFEEYWMRNITSHIKMNNIRDNFAFDAANANLNREKLQEYMKKMEDIQNNNIKYWKGAIRRIK